MNSEFASFMQTSRFGKLIALVLICLAAFLVTLTVNALKAYHYVGSGGMQNTITLTGTGEVFAVPDIATFTAGVSIDKPTAAEAEKASTEKMNAVIAYFKSSGIDEKDIKTVGYDVSPRYEYVQGLCTATECRPGTQVLKGFTASHSVSVKVRDTAKAGDLLSGATGKGATTVSGLSFTIDDDMAIKAQARDKAIADAKGKADALTKQLGVHLGKIVSFDENTNQPMPYYYGMGTGGGKTMDAVAAPAPEIATGQNQITSYVTVTYEIW